MAAGDSPRSEPSADDDATRLQIETATQANVDGLATSRVDRHFKALSGLASALDVVSGEKTIVFFSEGFDQRLLAGNAAESTSAADNDALAARAVLGPQRGPALRERSPPPGVSPIPSRSSTAPSASCTRSTSRVFA